MSHDSMADLPVDASEHSEPVHRPVGPAVLRGLLNRCPRCGEGRLFLGYLRTVEHCEVCGETIHEHRADDLPPYLTVFVVAHVIVALFMASEALVELSMWTHLAVWVPLTLLLSLALLRPFKGATVGLQWAMRMHGFGDESADTRTSEG